MRNPNGQGVLAGLTNIFNIVGNKITDEEKKTYAGVLWYRGHEISKLIDGLGDELGFEKITYC